MANILVHFAFRWLVCSLGLWIAAAFLGSERLSLGSGWGTIAAAGFFLAVVNMLVKPVLVVLSLPVLIFSLGLFMLVLNALMVMLASWIYQPLYVKNFGVAVVTGIIIGFINFLVTHIFGGLTSKKTA